MKDMSQIHGPWSLPCSDECPVADTLQLVGSKHGPKVLHCLVGGEMHFLELTRALHGISRKVLTDELTGFEKEGLVRRVEKKDARQRVGYSLTEKGHALAMILSQIFEWSKTYRA